MHIPKYEAVTNNFKMRLYVQEGMIFCELLVIVKTTMVSHAIMQCFPYRMALPHPLILQFILKNTVL